MDCPKEQPDGTLIDAVLAGDRDCFAEIVRRYERALLRLAVSRLRRREPAEEAVQETFLWAYKSLHSYDSRFSFRTWLWTILLNQCRRRLRKLARRPQVGLFADGRDEPIGGEVLAAGTTASHNIPLTALLSRERSEVLGELLDELPSGQADAIRLRFFGGLKFQETADALGCSLSGAKKRVRVGLSRLSARLAQHAAFEDEQGAAPATSGEKR